MANKGSNAIDVAIFLDFSLLEGQNVKHCLDEQVDCFFAELSVCFWCHLKQDLLTQYTASKYLYFVKNKQTKKS